MQQKHIEAIIRGDIPLHIKLMSFLVSFKKKVLLFKKGSFTGQKNIEGLVEYFIPEESFVSSKRKIGISGFARLKNGSDFLKKTIDSHISFFDEIVLVDNQSDDDTWKICIYLQKKYPDKVKIFQYQPEVYRLGSEQYKNVSENSVHNMAYYYNRVLSKTTYTYCIKIDDDHLLIPSVLKNIINNIRKNGLNSMITIPLYNIMSIDKKFYLPINFPFSGLFSDFGFFPISKNTYFIKDKKCENFLHNLPLEYAPVGFFHLKFLKKDMGTINYLGKIKEEVEKNFSSRLFPLSTKIVDLFIKLFYEN